MKMRHAILLLLIIGFQNVADGQQNFVDVVYLHNGSVIKGIIVEQIPNQTIKLQTADSSVFVFRMEEINKITKEQPITISANDASKATMGNFSLYAGGAFPIGDLGATSGDNAGYAKIGPCIGFQFSNVANGLYIGLGGTITLNPADEEEMRRANNIPNYITIDVDQYRSRSVQLMLGLGANDAKTQVYLSPLIGINNFTSPRMMLFDGITDVSEPETSATAIMYGGAAGINVKHGISIGVKYVTMEPEFDVKVFSEGVLILSAKTKSRLSMLQVTVGASF